MLKRKVTLEISHIKIKGKKEKTIFIRNLIYKSKFIVAIQVQEIKYIKIQKKAKKENLKL